MMISPTETPTYPDTEMMRSERHDHERRRGEEEDGGRGQIKGKGVVGVGRGVVGEGAEVSQATRQRAKGKMQKVQKCKVQAKAKSMSLPASSLSSDPLSDGREGEGGRSAWDRWILLSSHMHSASFCSVISCVQTTTKQRHPVQCVHGSKVVDR